MQNFFFIDTRVYLRHIGNNNNNNSNTPSTAAVVRHRSRLYIWYYNIMMWFSRPGNAGKEAAPNNARSSCFEYHLWVSLFKRRHHPLAEAITIFRTDFTYSCHRYYPRPRPARPLSKDSRAFRPNWTLLEKLSCCSCSTPREGFNSAGPAREAIIIIIII